MSVPMSNQEVLRDGPFTDKVPCLDLDLSSPVNASS